MHVFSVKPCDRRGSGIEARKGERIGRVTREGVQGRVQFLPRANFIKRYFSNYLGRGPWRAKLLASSLLVHSQPIFMGGVKRLESINIKKCRGIQELAPAYFLAEKKTGKLPSSADTGRKEVGRFKRHAMRSWIRILLGGEDEEEEM